MTIASHVDMTALAREGSRGRIAPTAVCDRAISQRGNGARIGSDHAHFAVPTALDDLRALG